jgi:hypothetical protein
MPMTEEAVQEKIRKKQEAAAIRLYKKSQTNYIMTSRFNTQTKRENQSFREKSWPNGCLYCTPGEVSKNIPLKAKMMVLEMDNDKNQIFAIGMCSNKSIISKYQVYENQNYNRYNYIGKHRIPREELNPIEEAVFKALDQLCFYGNEHMKRGYGLKAFPVKLLLNCKTVLDIPLFLENMFMSRFNKNI